MKEKNGKHALLSKVFILIYLSLFYSTQRNYSICIQQSVWKGRKRDGLICNIFRWENRLPGGVLYVTGETIRFPLLTLLPWAATFCFPTAYTATGVAKRVLLLGVINSNWRLSLKELKLLTGRHETLVNSSFPKGYNHPSRPYNGIPPSHKYSWSNLYSP